MDYRFVPHALNVKPLLFFWIPSHCWLDVSYIKVVFVKCFCSNVHFFLILATGTASALTKQHIRPDIIILSCSWM